MPAFAGPQTSGWLKLFPRFHALRPLLGRPRRENDIVGLYGAIYDALPRHLAQRLSLDTADGIRVILRTGQTFWFRPNTAVSVIVARIVEETSGCHAMPVPCPAATPARDIVARMRHDGCGGRAGKVELLTGHRGRQQLCCVFQRQRDAHR
jgi:hypothetical protein